MSRVKFNTYAGSWSRCMDKCPKYNRAAAPSFHDQEIFPPVVCYKYFCVLQAGMEEILNWDYNTFIDPNTTTIYEDVEGQAFWIPYRFHAVCIFSVIFIFILIVTLRQKDHGKTTTLARKDSLMEPSVSSAVTRLRTAH